MVRFRSLVGLLAIGAGVFLLTHGAHAQVIRNSVAVCNPVAPSQCASVNSSGAVPVTGTISVTGSNPAAGATGAAVPAQASYTGFNFSGNLKGWVGDTNGYGDVNVMNTPTVTANFGTGTGAVNATADTHAQCAALCTSLVVKGSAGVLKTFEVSADSTLSGAIWYVLVYDLTAKPTDGAVTPAKCYQQTSGTTQMGGTLGPGGTNYTTGITIAVSTTGCFTSTSSTHAFIGADFQ